MTRVGKQLIIANWKMNLTIHEASVLAYKLDQVISKKRNSEVVLAAPFLALQSLSLQIDHSKFKLAAQNCYWRDEGAFTGEISAHQLRGLVSYVLIGHSERRHVFNESGRDIGRKVQAAVRHGIKPVLCIGETAMEREAGETGDVIHDQLVAGLANLTSDEIEQVTIAYEPVWAISSGKDFAKHSTPTPQDIGSAARSIRSQIKHMFGKSASEDVNVLYGGSVSPDNANTFSSVDGINGLLVGGASLVPESFSSIISEAQKTGSVSGRKK